MELGAIFFTLAVTVLVGMYLYQPFMQKRKGHNRQEEHEYSALMAEYDRTLSALQELEFDNTLGKIPTEDYPEQRTDLLTRGADLLRKLDAFAPASGKRGGTAEGRVEAAVASRRADAADGQSATINDDDLEAMISARRKSRNGKSGGFCPKCGKAVMAADQFCPSCGKAIN